MTLDKHSFAGATIDLSAPMLTLRVAWKEVKHIVSRSCRAWQRCRVPRPRMRTFRVTRSFQSLLGQFCDPRNVNPRALQIYKKQHVAGHQPSHKDLGRGNVGPCEQREVDPNEFCPGGPAFALRRRRYTVTTQHVADRLIRDLMSQIGERPDDPIIAP